MTVGQTARSTRRLALWAAAMVLVLAISVVVPVPGSGSAQAAAVAPAGTAVEAPAQPSTIALASDMSTFTASQQFTLTAITDVPVNGTGSTISIVEQSSGAVLTSCTSGATCSVSTSFYSGDPRVYVATVNSLVSNEVVVGRAAWSVTLSVDIPTFVASEVPTLTATANQNVGWTGYSYSIWIMNAVTNEVLGQCNSGSTCSVSGGFYSGDPRTYVARIAPSSGGLPEMSAVQAVSNEVVVGRAAWSVTLSAEIPTFSAGEVPTLTATANQNVGWTGYSYYIWIMNAVTNEVVAQCGSGTTCTVPGGFYSGDPRTYVARIAPSSGGVPDMSAVQAVSNEVVVGRAAWSVTLSVTKTTFAAGETTTWTATANQTVSGTNGNYRIWIVDAVTNEAICYSDTGSTCTVTGAFYTGGPRTYVARVSARASTPALTDVQAVSNEVVVGRAAWSVTLSVTKTTFAAGETTTWTATANQTVSGTNGNYRIWIVDAVTNEAICYSDTGSTCTVTGAFYTGGPRTYVARVSARASTPELTDVQAVSNEVVVARATWSVSLTASSAPDQNSNPARTEITLVSVANQTVSGTDDNYVNYLLDYTTGNLLWSCSSGSTCTATFTVPAGDAPHTYVSMIAASSYGDDIQAMSNGYSLDTGTGAILAGETTGGSNASEKACQCSHADPVNTATGEFYLPAADIAIAGVGPAVGVQRTYSSSTASSDSSFGYGWASTLDMKMKVLIAGNTADPLPRQVQLVQENGATVVFTENADQSYWAPARVQATLSFDAAIQLWTYTRQQSQVFLFDVAGRLVGMRDLHGNQVTITRDTSGQATSMGSADGRSVQLTWSGTHVTGVVDSAGRSVTYGYDTAGNLTSATGVDGSTWTYAYNTGHFMTSLTAPGGGVTSNIYDASHRVTSQTDPIGRVTLFAYSSAGTTITRPGGSATREVYTDGRLTSQTIGFGTPEAATTTYVYDGASNVTSVIDPLGNVTNNTYDGDGNLLSRTDPLGRSNSWTYNDFNKPLTSTDPLGHVTTMTYDAAGNLLAAISPSGELHWTANADGSVASFEDASGAITTYGYNAAGLLTSSTDPDGRTTSLAYNPAGFVTSQTQPGGATTSIETDAGGRILSTTDAASETTVYAYNAAGETISVTAPNGDVVSTAYNLAGEITSSTDAAGNVTLFTYTPSGQVATVEDANGNVTTNAYNALGQLVSVTDPIGRVTSYAYDGAGRPVSATLPSGAMSSVVYDAAGQVLTSVDANGDESHVTYNSAGQPLTSTDPLSRVTAIRYNVSGLPDQVTLPDGSTQLSEYTVNGQLSKLTNPDGKETTYSYSASGLLTSKVEPGGLATSYVYDAAGRIQVATLPDGSTTTLTYNARGQVERVHYSDPAAIDTTYTHDSLGRVTSMTDATGTTSYTYDTAGRLVSEQNGAGATVGYDFDDVGQLTGVTYPGGDQIDYTYDAAGQMASLTDWLGETTTFSWTPDGQLLGQVLPNGVAEQRSYDPVGQLTGIETSKASAALADFGYDYDAAGQLTGTTAVLDGASVSNDYGFDELSQLASVTATPSGGTAATSALAATSAGLLTTTQSGLELAYNAAQQVVTATPATGPGTTFAYNAKGSRVSSTTAATDTTAQFVTAYEYSASGALASVATPSATVAYTSDGRGLRQSRTAGGVTAAFTWSTVGGLPLLLDDGGHRYIYGPSSTPLAQVDGAGVVEYLSADMLGTPRMITDEDGDVGATATFDAFGALASHTGAAVTRFGFTGNWTDPDTGLLYLRARDYDPATGQFLTVDPALDSTQQPYAYTGNNPVQRTDPTGLDWWSEAGENLLAAGAGALSNLTMGASDAILSAAVPGYDCFISEHAAAYGIGDLIVTAVSVALLVVPGVGLAAAGLLIAKTAIKTAIKTGLRQTIRTAAATARTSLKTVTGAITRAADDVPTVAFSRAKAPGIASNFDNAIANGAPTQLTRASTRAADANRRAALSGQPKAPAGQSLDEYPFASSQQGGTGSFVRAVDVGEQHYQGGVLAAFYRKFGIKIGDSFKVMFE